VSFCEVQGFFASSLRQQIDDLFLSNFSWSLLIYLSVNTLPFFSFQLYLQCYILLKSITFFDSFSLAILISLLPDRQTLLGFCVHFSLIPKTLRSLFLADNNASQKNISGILVQRTLKETLNEWMISIWSYDSFQEKRIESSERSERNNNNNGGKKMLSVLCKDFRMEKVLFDSTTKVC